MHMPLSMTLAMFRAKASLVYSMDMREKIRQNGADGTFIR